MDRQQEATAARAWRHDGARAGTVRWAWQAALGVAALALAMGPLLGYDRADALARRPDRTAASAGPVTPPVTAGSARARPASDSPVRARVPDPQARMAAWGRQHRADLAAHIRWLAARGDADSLVAAAWLSGLLAHDGEPADASRRREAESAAWLARAAALAPDDPRLAWLQVGLCPATVAGCGCTAALQRLQALDPDNAAVWLARLGDAADAGDAAAMDRLLARAARAGHYDARWVDTAGLLQQALARMPATPMDGPTRQAFADVSGAELGSPEGTRMAETIGLMASVPVPAMNIRHACSPPTAARRAACLQVVTAMAAAPTLVERGLGLQMGRRLAGDSGPWVERLRQLFWLQERVLGLQTDARWSWHRHVRAVLREGEIAAMEQALHEAGLPLLPPPGWLPALPQERALVAGGGADPGP